MSQFPPNPPIPIPPLPAQSLPYATPLDRHRPGLITAIGVMGIIIATLSILANAGFILQGWALIMMMKVTTLAANSAPPPTPIVATNPPSGTEAPLPTAQSDSPALTPAQTKIILSALNKSQKLSPNQRKQIQTLLTSQGQRLFPFASSGSLTESAVRANITDSGTMPGNAVYFVIGQGALHATDQSATFTFDNNQPSIQVVNNSLVDQPTPFAPTTFTPAQIDAVVQAAQAQSQNKLNPAQLATLKSELQSPTQQYIPPYATSQAASFLTSTTILPDQSAQIDFTGQSLTINPAGQVTSYKKNVTRNAFSPNFTFSVPAIATVLIESILSLGLAILLLVAAIQALRQAPSGRKLHLIYALTKIPLALVGAVAAWWMWSSFYQSLAASMPPNSGNSSPAGVFNAIALLAAVPAALGLLYAISLLLVLRAQSVRAYYNSVT